MTENKNIPSPSQSTIDKKEVEKFSALAEKWFDPEGVFAPLHQINPLRISYIKNTIIENIKTDKAFKASPLPFKGMRLLDVGCGGGLLAEPLARLGAHITAIDASKQNIKAAKNHAKQMGLKIDYRTQTAEMLATNTKERFDCILAMELLEHIRHRDVFLSHCARLLNAGGILFFSTFNRTLESYLFGILGAEYILRWLPRGTHNWNRFIRPDELNEMLAQSGLEPQHIKGMRFSLLKRQWELCDDIKVNYLGFCSKPDTSITSQG